MGLGFAGDSRGFSMNQGASSRIYHIVEINLQAAQLQNPICDSDPSHNVVVPRIVNGLKNGIPLADRIPDAPPMEDDYSDPDKKPRHEEHGVITPWRVDGDQSANVTIKYAGKNFAFWFSKGDLAEDVLGGPRSDRDRRDDTGNASGWGSLFGWNGVVPDLDVTNRLSIRINRPKGEAIIMCTTAGDGFPNLETFLIDAAGQTLFLGSHVRTGTATTQLPGGRLVPMTHCELSVGWNPNDTLTGEVEVKTALDYMSFGVTELASNEAMSLDDWNKLHTGRDASGAWHRQIQDNIPLGGFQQDYFSRPDLLDPSKEHRHPPQGGLFGGYY